jgi:hypothetical protein
MIRALLLLLCLASPGAAETARVLSGDHEDFTRLVIELPQATGWIVGRTKLGYAFAAKGEVQPDYDISAVWERISRSRLQDLAVDPATGALDLSLACECHIFPFEYGPGVIVLDIKPGQPPAASAFEAGFPQPALAVASAATDSAANGYDWLDRTERLEDARDVGVLPLPLNTGTVSLDPLRDELLEQIARGAVDGIVDMELPGKPQVVPAADNGNLPWSQIRIGEQPGVIVLNPDGFDDDDKPVAECPERELLDLPAWGSGKPVNDLLAEARADLFVEFDSADPEAVLRSVRSLLYLGFGAEARQHAAFLEPSAAPTELALYLSMAIIVDGGSDPQTPFAAMLDCDGPAALWAALAHDHLPRKGRLNRDAAVQAFLALPAHLRQHLGPGLAEKFLTQGDAEAARMIRDAINRAPNADNVAIAVLDARADLDAGNLDAAQSHAAAAVALDGDHADSLIALVEAHFLKLEPMEPEVAEALLALQGETQGTAIGADIDRALVLALGLSGQTEAAFANEGSAGPALADLWRVALDRATDDDFLRQAVLSSPAERPETVPEVGFGVAKRLLALGLADAALVWLGPVGPGDPPERRLLAASVALAQGDAKSAVQLLAAMVDPEAEMLRAKALIQLGDLAAAGEALVAAGKPEEALRLTLWNNDWARLDQDLPQTWLTTASHALSEEPGEQVGLLARGSETLTESLAAREAVKTLLSTVALPETN